MSRSLLLVPLLLAAGFALADDVPEANRVADAAERQAADDVPEADSEADGEEAGNVEEAAEGPCHREAGEDGKGREDDLRHVHPGQSGSAQVAGHRSLEELGARRLARHLDDARRLQTTHRQGSVHAGAELLRDQIGSEAVTGLQVAL